MLRDAAQRSQACGGARDFLLRGSSAWHGEVVPLSCFPPVASCYRRQAGPVSSAPHAPISGFRPAAYGEAVGARLYPVSCFLLLFTGNGRLGSESGRQRARVFPRGGESRAKSSNDDTIKSRFASGSVL